MLGYRFVLQTTVPGLGQLFESLYRHSMDDAADPDVVYSADASQSSRGIVTLHVDDEWIGDIERPSRLLSYLTWHINREVVARSSDWVLLHASAASRNGIGVLFPARSEAGKTTLVAGLVQSGFEYLTDEAAAINARTTMIEPYPKPLSIDRGSWSILGDLAPEPGGTSNLFFGDQWQVSPCSIRDRSVSGSVAPALVIFPEYVEGARTSLLPLDRVQGLLTLLHNTFNLQRNGHRDFSVLAELVRGVECYRLVSGSLREACAEVSHLV